MAASRSTNPRREKSSSDAQERGGLAIRSPRLPETLEVSPEASASEKSISSRIDEMQVQEIGAQKRPVTLVEFVTAQLRDAITKGRLAPGQRLWQDNLAQDLQVSRAPVREALRQLASEGLVTLHSHRSAIVASLSPDELEELSSMIIHLEALAAKRAISRLTTEQLDEMAELVKKMWQRRSSPAEWFALNSSFHRILIQAANWPTLLNTVDVCRRNIFRYVTIEKAFRAEVALWIKRNERLLGACRARNIESALKIIREAEEHSRAILQAEIDKRR